MITDKEKILLKLSNSTNIYGRCEWRHLCYVDKELCDSYLSTTGKTMVDMGKTIVGWCKRDFQKDIKLNTRKSIEELREIIKNHYKTKYPELYHDSNTDRQGWVRVWITENMKKELEKYGK